MSRRLSHLVEHSLNIFLCVCLNKCLKVFAKLLSFATVGVGMYVTAQLFNRFWKRFHAFHEQRAVTWQFQWKTLGSRSLNLEHTEFFAPSITLAPSVPISNDTWQRNAVFLQAGKYHSENGFHIKFESRPGGGGGGGGRESEHQKYNKINTVLFLIHWFQPMRVSEWH